MQTSGTKSSATKSPWLAIVMLAALAMISGAAFAQPELQLIKTVTTEDGVCGEDDVDFLTTEVGAFIKYCYVVLNVGDQPLFDISVLDDNGTMFFSLDDFDVDLEGLEDLDDGGYPNDLPVDGYATGEAFVEFEFPTFIAGIATASGATQTGEGEVVAHDDAEVLVNGGGGGGGEENLLELNVTVTTPGEDCSEAEDSLKLPAPGEVKFCYELINLSEEELAVFYISLIDDAGTPEDYSDDFEVILDLTDENDDGEDDDLAAGETAFGEVITYLDMGSYTNLATATGIVETFDGEEIEQEATDSSTVCVGLDNAIRATTGDIRVDENATVDGADTCDCIYSAVLGDGGNLVAGGSVIIDPLATVIGEVIENEPTDPTPTMVPDGLSLSGNLEVRSGETLVLEEGDYYYDSIFIKDNSAIETTGKVRVWFRSRLEVGGNAPIMPADNLSANLTFLSTSESNYVEVKSNAYLIGSIMAPNVENLRLGSNADIFGTVVGASVIVHANSNVHKDAALCDGCTAAPEGSELPTITNALEASIGEAYIGQFALVDSYSSCDGFYGGANVGGSGAVQASLDVTLHPDAIVNGDLLPFSPSNQTAVPIPEGLESSGTLFINSNETVTLPEGDYLFEDVFLNSNADLITGPGLVRIWFTGRLEIGSNAHAVAASENPADLWFFGGCGPNDVLINESSSGPNLIGVVHAPDLPTLIMSNSHIYGGVVGADIEVRPNANVHYDEALAAGCE